MEREGEVGKDSNVSFRQGEFVDEQKLMGTNDMWIVTKIEGQRTQTRVGDNSKLSIMSRMDN